MNIFALRELWNEKGADFKRFFYGFAGNTPLQKLPDEVNPQGNIYTKREDFEPTGSLKIRAAAGIHFLEYENLQGKYISLASSGNFAKDLPYVLERTGTEVKIKDFISEKIAQENPELVSKIKGEIIEIKDEEYCPASHRKRGKAIAYAKAEQKFYGAVAYNQYEHIGNIFGNLTLGEEIFFQAGKEIAIVQSLGTGGSAIGNYYGQFFASGESPLFYGLIPQEEHHQLGLRSFLEQGDSEFFKEIKSFAKEIIEISDKEAFNSMEKLWEARIPAGISIGTNYAGALKLAEKTNKNIVTIMPDSISGRNYRTFLKKYFENITGRPFDEHLYKSLQ